MADIHFNVKIVKGPVYAIMENTRYTVKIVMERGYVLMIE
jgi:hypothetical protein